MVVELVLRLVKWTADQVRLLVLRSAKWKADQVRLLVLRLVKWKADQVRLLAVLVRGKELVDQVRRLEYQ